MTAGVITNPAVDTLEAQLARLPAVTLEALVDQAELQTRTDRKYVVTVPILATMLDEIRGDFAVLDMNDRRSFHYSSQYFDTDDLLCFREHRQGRRRRFKVRTRTYVDSSECMLEVKAVSPRGQTVKQRIGHRVENAARLTTSGMAFAADALAAHPAVPWLTASVATDYHRSTLLDQRTSSRLTIDVDLRFTGRYDAVAAPHDTVIVETKTAGRPGRADHALRRLGARPISVSKYCVGVALLHPGIPANRWNRTLRRYFNEPPSSHGPLS